jgi:hypothetical protein
MEKTDFKIVCIIDTYTSNKNIFWATNRNVSHNNFTKKIEELSATVPYLLITKDNYILTNAIDEKKAWDILLIYDGDVNNNIGKGGSFLNILHENSLIMWHVHAERFIGKDTLEQWIKNKKIIKYKIGIHDKEEEHGYSKLKYLIDAWDDTTTPGKFKLLDYEKVKEKLIKWFGLNEKLNAVLEFLHQSLEGTPASESVLTKDSLFDLSLIYNGKTIQQWVDELKDKTGDEYTKSLRTLRDVLLKEAEIY